MNLAIIAAIGAALVGSVVSNQGKYYKCTIPAELRDSSSKCFGARAKMHQGIYFCQPFSGNLAGMFFPKFLRRAAYNLTLLMVINHNQPRHCTGLIDHVRAVVQFIKRCPSKRPTIFHELDFEGPYGFLSFSVCCKQVKVYQSDEDNWDARDEQEKIFTIFTQVDQEMINKRVVYKSHDGKRAIAFDGETWNIQNWDDR